MQKPFLELTHLQVSVDGDLVPLLPDLFLSGSAPHLRTLVLRSIPFPSIPKLLLSAHGLVTLSLWDIPDSGYFSPDAMATALTVMTRLDSNPLIFDSIPLDLAPTQQADLCLRPHALFSSLLPNLYSKASISIWRTFWPESMPLFSTTSTSAFSWTSTLTSHNFTGLSVTQRSSRHSTTHRCGFSMTQLCWAFPPKHGQTSTPCRLSYN